MTESFEHHEFAGGAYLAIDLGAESGRVIAATIAGNKLELRQVHRFVNAPVRLPDGIHWDILRLYSEIKSGIAGACKSGARLDGIGVDTWGVDFALLDSHGELLGNPYHYRDPRTDGMLELAFQRMPRADIFEHTGIQFMQINTLFQLFSMASRKSPLLDLAQTFVTIPDLLNYWLSGQIACEFTNATTTQCYDPRQGDWAWPVLEALGIPQHIFKPVTQPGSILGPLTTDLVEECGAGAAQVIAPACHDTGSAVVAVPAQQANFAWISSGTWSIMGVEASQPGISEQTLEYNFTNEGGVFGRWRLSKNIMGLWLVQECRRTWALHGEELSYEEITRLAAAVRPFQAVIDPDDSAFLHPGDMPGRIQDFCRRTNQPVPQTKGEIARVALESIALKYRWVLERLEEVTSTRLEPIHIIGGGTQNHLLNQLTADATGRRVVCGPVEATAIGNILVQAIALGHLGSLEEARTLVRSSFNPKTFHPGHRDGWDEAYGKLLSLLTLGL
jgi:rhamnulokinase